MASTRSEIVRLTPPVVWCLALALVLAGCLFLNAFFGLGLFGTDQAQDDSERDKNGNAGDPHKLDLSGMDRAELTRAFAGQLTVLPPQAPAPRNEIVFVDPGVAQRESLLAALHPQAKVIELLPNTGSLTQIAAALSQEHNVTALHLICHGEEARLKFSSGGDLTLDTLPRYAAQLRMVRAALAPNADVLLYGCCVAKGVDGKALVNALARATGAAVAASEHPTGALARGGSWSLDYRTGAIHAAALAPWGGRDYTELLKTWTVTSASDNATDTSSLRYVLSQAQSGDTITFDPSLAGQTINVTNVGDTSFGPAALGVSTTLTIDGSGAPGLVISGLMNYGTKMRLFTVTNTGNLTMKHLTLTYGSAHGRQGGGGSYFCRGGTGGGAAGLGGAIFNAGSLSLYGCTLKQNSAVGGAGYNYSYNAAFTFNTGGGGGGGLYNSGNVQGADGSGAAGGGPNGGLGGSAGANGASGQNGGLNGGGGGGGYLGGKGGSGGIFGGGGGGAFASTIGGAGGNGGFGGGGGGGGASGTSGYGGTGGLGGTAGFGAGSGSVASYGSGGPGGGGAGMGGAVFNYGGTLNVTNCTLFGNYAYGGYGAYFTGQYASGLGGGIFNRNGQVTVNNSTIAGNQAAQGGGIYNLGDGAVATLALNSTIAADNGGDVDVEGNTINGGTNTTSGMANLIVSQVNFAGGIASSAAPLFPRLANNGGPTQTMLPPLSSPALNAGANPANLQYDQRGSPRSSGTTTDIGAVEQQGAYVTAVSVPANSTYISGNTLSFTVDFSDRITVSGGIPYLQVILVSGTAQAAYVSGSGSAALVFQYTVSLYDNAPAPNGISLGTIMLNGATLLDSSGLNAKVALHNVPATAGIIITTTKIAINGGDGQTAPVTTKVGTAPSVLVQDTSGNPLADVTVTFVPSSSAKKDPIPGTVTGGITTTNASGIATVGSWTLGSAASQNNLTATAAGLSVTFTATATATAASQIRSYAGNNQTAPVNTAVPIPPSVLVSDQYGNPVSGVVVNFTVAYFNHSGGQGGITNGSAITGSAGLATPGAWTLGPLAGSNSLTATASGITGNTASFSAWGTSPQAPAITSALTLVVVSGQSLSYNITASNSPFTGFAATNLPSGLVLNPDSGEISGATTLVGWMGTTVISASNASGTGSAWLAISVVPAVFANPQTVSVTENTNAAITLSGTDVSGQYALSYAIVAGPFHGSLSGTAPNLTYTPTTNYTGADVITFTVSDANGPSAPTAVSIMVSQAQAAGYPLANSQAVTLTENTAIAITLSGTDTSGQYALTYSLVAGPFFGSLSGTAPKLTYTPTTNYSGADVITFTVSDANGTSAPATVSIAVSPAQAAGHLFANSQAVTLTENSAIAITLSGTDTSGQYALTYSIVAGPFFGSLSGTAPKLTYTPGANFTGADGFTFTVSDVNGTSALAAVALTVSQAQSANHLLANSQAVALTENSAIAITLSGTDTSGQFALTYAVVAGPSHGNLSGAAANWTYTPNANQHAADSFTFTVSDVNGTSAAATVSLTVLDNTTPSAGALNLTVNENASVPVNLSATDSDTTEIFTYAFTSPAHGTLSGTPPNLVYTPSPQQYAADSFTYTADNGTNTSAAATVNLTVLDTAVPTVLAQTVTVKENSSVAVVLLGADSAGNALTYSVVSVPASGSITGTAPDLTYTPNAGFSGMDSFTYQASDGQVYSAPAVVTIVVVPLSAPAISSLQVTPAVAVLNQPVTATATVTLSNGGTFACEWDFGDGTTVAGATAATHTYTAIGAYQVTFTATSSDGVIATQTVTETVSLGIKSPGSGTTPPGVTGTPVTKQNGKATLALNLATGKAKSSTFTGLIDGIAFPKTVAQADLAGSATLTVGGGKPYTSTLNAKGTGTKNGGLSAFVLNLKKQTLTFAISSDTSLNTVMQALPGFEYQATPKKGTKFKPFTFFVPVVITVGGKSTTYPIGVTFVMLCLQSSTNVKGAAAATQ